MQVMEHMCVYGAFRDRVSVSVTINHWSFSRWKKEKTVEIEITPKVTFGAKKLCGGVDFTTNINDVNLVLRGNRLRWVESDTENTTCVVARSYGPKVAACTQWVAPSSQDRINELSSEISVVGDTVLRLSACHLIDYVPPVGKRRLSANFTGFEWLFMCEKSEKKSSFFFWKRYSYVRGIYILIFPSPVSLFPYIVSHTKLRNFWNSTFPDPGRTIWRAQSFLYG